ncbi:hypothetical protein GJ744_011282 [Endocarpon pusillum]|uniref:DNA-directed RNA polymerases I, II, and III subunit RPABC3 n=1 Tax=Endocarpon pusillum TaxID=364733 RepID=A0A8H7ATS0_9EURO|nr:hypothetical protein GJ744_011282 [Endocarpon pusillum]
MSEPILFEDAFSILSVNSQKYERVSRIAATSNDQQISLTLDVNTELYPVNVSDRVQIALALTLNLDGSKDDTKGWRDVGLGERSLADEYDYVCHGKIYRFEEGNQDDIKVYVSFGGLLLYIEGPYSKLNPLRIDYVYLLMKR